MGLRNLLTAFILSSATTLLCHLLRTYWRLRTVPGPLWAKITNLQRLWWVLTGRAHEIHTSMHEKYGPLVRIGPNVVSVSDPEYISVVYPAREGFPKSAFYRVQQPYTRKDGAVQAIFNTQDEDFHKSLRKPIAYLYSMTNVTTFEPIVDEVLDVLFRQVDARFVKTGDVCDLGSWLQYFAFDLMGSLTFSKRYGFIEEGRDVNGILSAVGKFMKAAAPIGQVPWVDRLLYKNPVATLFQKTAGSTILGMVNRYITERQSQRNDIGTKGTKTDKPDMLSYFLEVRETKPNVPHGAPKAWTFANVKAGSDSTASSMQSLFYYLLIHPHSMDRLLVELEELRGLKEGPCPIPRWEHVQQLSYLDACFWEALRLHPPFSLPLERVVPASGITICGHYLPPGTVVGMNPYVVNKKRSTFGEDSTRWRPERWMELKPEERRKLERNILTFGAGRRACLGKNIAVFEVKKLVAAFLLRYEVQIVDPLRRQTHNAWFFRQWGIDVIIKQREMATHGVACSKQS
ncbi:hypothetical protein CNMCM8980_001760 [Aspergillus fumigatiaffinis]|uniref:Cytochrome P450 oxidoreductase n=1 Tax=Aspergillus fumigatiaffinis TaxID=340414 RepID=A0A8H4GU52_9EURO|nr:hypothetical protein CNMCM6805_002149 [Aspergillus fumigatiaffinis]KAF4239310.1 hypothetical protein CNMCM8980_001760 [Aspergillus fumigatiaffinis]